MIDNQEDRAIASHRSGAPSEPQGSRAKPPAAIAEYTPPPWERMWFDPECGEDGCQSLIWRSRYESAVQGRRDFRAAYGQERKRVAELLEAVRAAQALATACMATGCYSHDELTEMARATKPVFDAALAASGAA